MATLDNYIGGLPVLLQNKYSANNNALFIDWCNKILEKIESMHVARSLLVEKGLEVSDKVWIDPPSDYKHAIEIFDNENRERKYPFDEVNERIQLLKDEVEEDTDPVVVDTLSTFTTTSFDSDNLSGKSLDEYENYLFVVTAGTLAGSTFRIIRNDASVGSTTTFYYLHPLKTAWTAGQVTDGKLISPDYYVILRYNASFARLTASTEEIPVLDNYEDEVMSSGLRYMAERFHGIDNRMVQEWKGNYNTALMDLQKEIETASLVGPLTRSMPGLQDDSEIKGGEEGWSGFYG